MDVMPKTTEELVLEVLHEFDFKHDRRFIRHLVAVLEDPDMIVPEVEVNASPAAEWVRSSLFLELGGAVASSVTCDLFYTLGRENELGWIEEHLPDYRFKG
jgi:hypothetical protein